MNLTGSVLSRYEYICAKTNSTQDAAALVIAEAIQDNTDAVIAATRAIEALVKVFSD